MPETKGDIKTGRFSVPYRVYGEKGPWVICVNGIQQTMAAWHSVISRFSKKYRIVIFDFPGQGRARILDGPSLVSLDEQAGILSHVIQTLVKREKIHLVGASWGTVVAAAYASRYPQKVDKLILGSFGVRPTKKMLELIDKGQEMFRKGKGPELAHLIIDHFGERVSSANKKKMVQQFHHMKRENFLTFYAHCESIAKIRHIRDFVDLRKIRAKTLLINGEDDTLLDNRDLEVASREIPHCEVKIVKNAGHFLHWEREDILNIYEEYLQKDSGNGIWRWLRGNRRPKKLAAPKSLLPVAFLLAGFLVTGAGETKAATCNKAWMWDSCKEASEGCPESNACRNQAVEGWLRRKKECQQDIVRAWDDIRNSCESCNRENCF